MAESHDPGEPDVFVLILVAYPDRSAAERVASVNVWEKELCDHMDHIDDRPGMLPDAAFRCSASRQQS